MVFHIQTQQGEEWSCALAQKPPRERHGHLSPSDSQQADEQVSIAAVLLLE